MIRRLMFANFKLVYQLSQSMRQRFSSNGILILLIIPVAGVFGFNTRSTLSFQIFSITLIALLTAISYSFFLRGRFFVTRTLPDYGTVGTPLYYSCTIKNKTNKAKKNLILIDNLHAQFPTFDTFKKTKDPLDKKRNRVDRFIGYPRLVNVMQKLRGASIKPIRVDYVAENSETKATMALTPLRRGYFYFDKTKIAQTDPFGLFQAQKTIPLKDKLLILPKLYKSPKLNLHGKRTYQHGGVNQATHVGDSQEFVSLRDYRPGDPLKSIHWRSYAKNNKPIVKEYQDEFFIRNGLILDTFLNNKSDDIFEDAVSIAASFISAQQEHDALLDLMFIGNSAYRFTSGRGLSGKTNLLEVLACIQPTYESNIDELTFLVKQHLRECSALIYILLDLDEPRRKLLNKLSELSIPVKALLLTEEDNIKNQKDIQSLNVQLIKHGELQNGLDKLI